jgi:hypothetical protein
MEIIPREIESMRYCELLFDLAGITKAIIDYPYPGSGMQEDLYIIRWIPNDPRNPLLFSIPTKWFTTALLTFATFALTLVSSTYTGGIIPILHEFGISQEVGTLIVSLFVVGFAIGPLV